MAELNDREAIFSHIIRELCSTMLMTRGHSACGSEHYKDFQGGQRVHFAPWKNPEPGDLVIEESTHSVHDFLIGWYVEPWQDGAVIREIGSSRLCNYGNARFTPILGLHESQLYEGVQRQMYHKVLRAFVKGDEYLYRFGGLKFAGNVATITIREAFGGFGRPSQPFDAQVTFDKRTSVKKILQAMRDAGYGTRSFKPESPAPGEESAP